MLFCFCHRMRELRKLVGKTVEAGLVASLRFSLMFVFPVNFKWCTDLLAYLICCKLVCLNWYFLFCHNPSKRRLFFSFFSFPKKINPFFSSTHIFALFLPAFASMLHRVEKRTIAFSNFTTQEHRKEVLSSNWLSCGRIWGKLVL